MKVAVWCSTGHRSSTNRKDTDAEYLEELKGSDFVYMDELIMNEDDKHFKINLFMFRFNTNQIKKLVGEHKFDAIVLENCPLNLPNYKVPPISDKFLYNCMILLKDKGLLFVRNIYISGSNGPLPLGVFKPDNSQVVSELGSFKYVTLSKNETYKIYEYNLKITNGGGKTVKQLQALCKKHHLAYSGLRKAELIVLLKKMKHL